MGGDATAIGRLLGGMTQWNASDLFLCEGKVPAVRIDGAVVELDASATTRADIDAFFDAALTDEARARFVESGDLDVGVGLDDERVRFRVNVGRQRGRIAIVARALPRGDLSFEDLHLPAGVARLADLKRGLVLVTGATGSGKSTTLAAMVHRINRSRPVHVVTIEDPIEFVHDDQRARISQREVGADTVSFGAALRHVLRESPDVILVGEIRDVDTMRVALSAALSGHLVLATLHTIDAGQTLQRVLSYYAEHLRRQVAIDLSLALRGVVSQRLLPRAEGAGRVVAVELLTVTPAASRLIRELRTSDLIDLMAATEDPGVITFGRALLDLHQRGLITYEVGEAYATNPEEFVLGAQGMRTGVEAFRGSDDDEGDRALGLDMKRLIEAAQAQDASDLHLSVGRPPILRVVGALQPLSERALSAGDMRALLFSVMSVRQRETYQLEREIDFALALDDGQRFRVNAYFQKGHMAAALRAIPSTVPTAEELRLPGPVLTLADQPHGLALVVGPTGSGKTTTLACLVDRINKTRRAKVITVEDPIEYVHSSDQSTVHQREVYADTPSFGSALKYILRQDPDVIMVGEMRDLDTVGAALTAAETGHLVLATLHTNDAVQTIDRIVDVFPAHQQSQARAQLAASLIAVVSQRLLPRADGSGRVPAFELMVATTAIRTLIRDNKMHQALSAMETARKDGMITLDRSLKGLYEGGLITFDDALRYMRQPTLLGEPPRARS